MGLFIEIQSLHFLCLSFSGAEETDAFFCTAPEKTQTHLTNEKHKNEQQRCARDTRHWAEFININFFLLNEYFTF